MKSNNFKNFFYYSNSEKYGIVTLFTLITFFFIIPFTYPLLFKKATLDFSEFKDELVLFEGSTTEANNIPIDQQQQTAELFPFDPNTASKNDLVRLGLSNKQAQTIINYRSKVGEFSKKEDLKKIYGLQEEEYNRLASYINIAPSSTGIDETSVSKKVEETPEAITMFPFNPNTASKKDFIALGLSEKQAATIIKYRTKGGQFNEPEDLKKIYGLKENDYDRLADYIDIPNEEEEVPTSTTIPKSDIPKSYNEPIAPKKPVKKVTIIDINSASIDDWQSLYGIGKGYATRIMKFKNALGGFVSIEQVSETFGLPDSTFQQIKPNLKLNNTDIRKINLNTATVKSLSQHPYLSTKQANVIINYRKQHGGYSTVEDLKKVVAISGSVYQKIIPYLKVE